MLHEEAHLASPSLARHHVITSSITTPTTSTTDDHDATAHLSRIAPLDQRTALPDQCLHSAEADVRPPRRRSGFDTLNGHVTLVWAL